MEEKKIIYPEKNVETMKLDKNPQKDKSYDPYEHFPIHSFAKLTSLLHHFYVVAILPPTRSRWESELHLFTSPNRNP